jgi:glucoamylase
MVALPIGGGEAFGAPGLPPRWSHSNKDGLGTAYAGDSRLWFTLWKGIVTELYFPTLDRPQLRDLELLFTDGASLFYEEKRDLAASTTRIGEDALAYRVHAEAPEGRFRLRKTILTDPHLPCLLMRVHLDVTDRSLVGRLRPFLLAAPHLAVGGWGNSASVRSVVGRSILLAEKDGIALAIAASRPFVRTSVGYVGASDGWTDLNRHHDLTWQFDRAPDGNVALTGEIPLEGAENEFTIGVALGESPSAAITTLFQSLGTPFDVHERRFLAQWRRTAHGEEPGPSRAGDGGRLYRASRAVLFAHEDKTYPGGFVASLSIPWGAAQGDEDRGGYHLVWVRDLFHAATGLLATGSTEAPLRALIYLATRQQPDGGFPQNFWIDGRPYWRGLQLDEVAFPILLAGALHRVGGLAEFDPAPMVYGGARFLILHGPVTQQDRWEEVSGYSPSTLAASIAALTTAAGLARRDRRPEAGALFQEYADFLEAHVEAWTVTSAGTLHPDVRRHFVRIRPADTSDPIPHEGPELGTVRLPNLEPGTPNTFPADEIVGAGFLDLVRFGIRSPDDPLIRDSLRVVDRVLKVDTPAGPVWRRYNHDGYGERPDGSAFDGWGIGRAWPLLVGERGHYELARGADPHPYLAALERLATSTGLLPEQVWDEEDRPARHLYRGRPTESATPLVWAHAEYVKLLRSASERAVFDRIPEVAERYLGGRPRPPPPEFWTFQRQLQRIPPGIGLRVAAGAPFVLHVSGDNWAHVRDVESTAIVPGLHVVPLEPLATGAPGWVFTFRWTDGDRWEGRDYRIVAETVPPPATRP